MVLKVMPESPDTNLSELTKEVEKEIKDYGGGGGSYCRGLAHGCRNR